MTQNPIDNLTFDWLTVLQNKAEGINAYGKYIADAREQNSDECVTFFEQLREIDVEQVSRIKQHLEKMISSEPVTGSTKLQSKGSESHSMQ